jgi:hypothetical protein
MNVGRRFHPDNKICAAGPDNRRLRLHPETLIFKILHGFNNKSGLTGNQRN